MSASHSTSKTSDSTSTNTNTELTTINKNVSGNAGLTAVADTNSTLNLSYAPISVNTDFGAIDAAARIADAGVNAGAFIANRGLDASITAFGTSAKLAGDAVTKAIDANTSANSGALASALTFASASEKRAFDIVGATTASNASNAREYAEGVVNFAGGVLTQFGKTLADYQTAEQTQLGNTVSALNDSYRDANKSSDQRIAEIAQSSTDLVREVFKYALIAGGIAIGAFLLSHGAKAFKGARA